MSNIKVAALVAMLTELALARPRDPHGDYLLQSGWVPLGAEAFTGVEGWGKVIDGRAVTAPMPEALAIQRAADRTTAI